MILTCVIWSVIGFVVALWMGYHLWDESFTFPAKSGSRTIARIGAAAFWMIAAGMAVALWWVGSR